MSGKLEEMRVLSIPFRVWSKLPATVRAELGAYVSYRTDTHFICKIPASIEQQLRAEVERYG